MAARLHNPRGFLRGSSRCRNRRKMKIMDRPPIIPFAVSLLNARRSGRRGFESCGIRLANQIERVRRRGGIYKLRTIIIRRISAVLDSLSILLPHGSSIVARSVEKFSYLRISDRALLVLKRDSIGQISAWLRHTRTTNSKRIESFSPSE